MRLAALALVACAVPAVARAEPPGLVIPVPADSVMPEVIAEAPVVERASYRWQVVAVDAMAVATMMLAERDQSSDWARLGLGSYALGAPLVHAGNGHGGRALGSLALRVGLPLIGGLVGKQLVGAAQCAPAPPGAIDSVCEDSVEPGFIIGAAVGVVGAMVLDAALIARPTTRRSWSPMASAGRNGFAVGLASAF